MRPQNKKRRQPYGLKFVYCNRYYVPGGVRLLISWTLLVCIVFMIIGFGPHTVSSLQTTPRRAVINTLEGSVMVQHAGQPLALPARQGMELKTGDRVITGHDGRVEVRFDDGSISRIAPNSRTDLQSLYRQGADGPEVTVLEGRWGRLWNNIKEVVQRNSRFDVNTPSVVAGVRGTLFLIRVEVSGETLVRVYQGRVEANPPHPGRSLLINAFQQAVFVPGEPLPVKADPIDFSDIDDFELLNLMKDNPRTFTELLLLAAAHNEKAFLQRVEALTVEAEGRERLGEDLYAIQALLEDLLSPEPEPEPVPEPEPQPKPEPEVSMAALSDITLLEGQIGEVKIQTDAASLQAFSSDTGVAETFILNSSVLVEALSPGTSFIAVTGSRSGYINRTETFKVTVEAAPDQTEIIPSKALFDRKDKVAFITVERLIDKNGNDVLEDFSYGFGGFEETYSCTLTDNDTGKINITVASEVGSSDLRIPDTLEAEKAGAYTLTITRKKNGQEWNIAVTVTDDPW